MTNCTLLVFLEEITQQMDEGYPMDVLCLDFSKVFDRVPQERLLLKLKNHGITGTVLKCALRIEAWLSHRKQRVLVCGEASEWSSVTS